MSRSNRDPAPGEEAAFSITIGWMVGALLLAVAALVIAGSRASGELTPGLLASLVGLGLAAVGSYIGLESLRQSRTASTTLPRLEAHESFVAARQTAWLAGALVVLGTVLLIAPLFAPSDTSSGTQEASPSASGA